MQPTSACTVFVAQFSQQMLLVDIHLRGVNEVIMWPYVRWLDIAFQLASATPTLHRCPACPPPPLGNGTDTDNPCGYPVCTRLGAGTDSRQRTHAKSVSVGPVPTPTRRVILNFVPMFRHMPPHSVAVALEL